MDQSNLPQYNSELERWIVAAVRSGAKDFWQLVSVLPGVYPTVVREAVDRLTSQSRIPENMKVERPKPGEANVLDLEVPGLPPPHPLSSDWRFTRATASDLLERVTKATSSATSVALLGTPSVFFMAALNDVSGQFILLDENVSLADRVPRSSNGSVFQRSDVKRDVVDIPAVQTVLADPPWYKEDVLGFLRTAARVCDDKGTIFLSFGSEGTRPGIVAERDFIIDEAGKMGLEFVGIEPLILSYTTPFFEYNALRAAQFKHIPMTWRRGDLLQFRKYRDNNSVGESLISSTCTWTAAHVSGIEIRVRKDKQSEFADPQLIPLIGGDILPSVSRRDSLGRAAEVWTVGNRVYRCDGKSTLLALLEALEGGSVSVEGILQRSHFRLNGGFSEALEKTMAQVRGIVETERRDFWKFCDGRS